MTYQRLVVNALSSTKIALHLNLGGATAELHALRLAQLYVHGCSIVITAFQRAGIRNSDHHGFAPRSGAASPND